MKELRQLKELALNKDIKGNDLRIAILLLNDNTLTKTQIANTLGFNVSNVYPMLKRLEKANFKK